MSYKRTRSHSDGEMLCLEFPKRCLNRCHICMSVARNTGKVLEMTTTHVDSDLETCHLVCGHLFHINCIVRYFDTSPSPTCPLCRDRTYISWKADSQRMRYYQLLEWTLEEDQDPDETDSQETQTMDPHEYNHIIPLVELEPQVPLVDEEEEVSRFNWRRFFDVIHDE